MSDFKVKFSESSSKFTTDFTKDATVTVDSSLSTTSKNPVQNKVITDALNNKQDNLKAGANISIVNNTISATDTNVSVDTELSTVSNNPVQNKVITNALSEKQDTLIAGTNIKIENNVISSTASGGGESVDVDSSLSTTSTNPVQNKVITAALNGKQNTLTIDSSLSTTSTNPVRNSVITNALNNKLNTADLPTIPTVNNATLTIQKNATNIATFTANSNTNATANIEVPTNISELTNDVNILSSNTGTKNISASSNTQVGSLTLSAGLYIIQLKVASSTAGTGSRQLMLTTDTSLSNRLTDQLTVNSSSVVTRLNSVALLEVTDSVTVYGYLNSSVALSSLEYLLKAIKIA